MQTNYRVVCLQFQLCLTLSLMMIFRVRPLHGLRFPLKVIREQANRFHHNELLIKSESREKYLQSVRTFADHQNMDIFDKKIGRVSYNLADILAPLIEQREITKGKCITTGKRIDMGGVKGGGQQLECLFLFQAQNSDAAQEIVTSIQAGGLSVFVLHIDSL